MTTTNTSIVATTNHNCDGDECEKPCCTHCFNLAPSQFCQGECEKPCIYICKHLVNDECECKDDSVFHDDDDSSVFHDDDDSSDDDDDSSDDDESSDDDDSKCASSDSDSCDGSDECRGFDDYDGARDQCYYHRYHPKNRTPFTTTKPLRTCPHHHQCDDECTDFKFIGLKFCNKSCMMINGYKNVKECEYQLYLFNKLYSQIDGDTIDNSKIDGDISDMISESNHDDELSDDDESSDDDGNVIFICSIHSPPNNEIDISDNYVYWKHSNTKTKIIRIDCSDKDNEYKLNSCNPENIPIENKINGG
jgi:hypothetical protein